MRRLLIRWLRTCLFPCSTAFKDSVRGCKTRSDLIDLQQSYLIVFNGAPILLWLTRFASSSCQSIFNQTRFFEGDKTIILTV